MPAGMAQKPFPLAAVRSAPQFRGQRPNGSGAVFFAGCTLRCCYCQNHTISAEGFGRDVTPQRLRAIFEELIAQGAHNIDLITRQRPIYLSLAPSTTCAPSFTT